MTFLNTILLFWRCITTAGYIYETHIMENPLLPFIFHRDTRVEQLETPPNWHENIEILHCIAGSGFVKCGLEETLFSTGEIFVVNSDTPHAICSGTSIIYDCLIIDSGFCKSNGIPISGLRFQCLIRDELLNRDFSQVSAAFAQLSGQALCAVADIRCAVLTLLCRLCRDYVVSTAEPTQSVSSERVKTAMAYIRKNISSPITLDDISSFIGISKYHLAREFKAFTGMTVIDTVNLIRCSEARQLIENGMSVSAAAMTCGFENLSYFTRTFKKHFHALPSAFLKRS